MKIGIPKVSHMLCSKERALHLVRRHQPPWVPARQPTGCILLSLAPAPAQTVSSPLAGSQTYPQAAVNLQDPGGAEEVG